MIHSLQNCFNSGTLVGLEHKVIQVIYQIISTGLKSGLRLGRSFFSFFFNHSKVDLLLCFWFTVLLHNPTVFQLQGTNWVPFFPSLFLVVEL